MMFEQVQRDANEPVTVVSSQAAADLLVATLQANGITATAGIASVYPSLDWVDGVAVAVAVADLEAARDLVRMLGHDPLDPPGAADA
jgi:hypothetical protein